MAQKFDVEKYNSLPKPVLAAVSSCRVTKFQDLQLTGTPSTHWYLNPQIEDMHLSITEYQAMYAANPPLAIQKQPFNDIELEKMRNRYPLRTLLNQNPRRYKADRFTTEATIVDFNTRFSFKAFIRDETTQIAVTFFSQVADAFTNVDCNTMVTKLGFTDPRILPEPLIKLRGIKKVFQFHFNQNSAIGNADFVLDKIMDISDATRVDKEATLNMPTPPDETQYDKQNTSEASMPNKRKTATKTETSKAKYIKQTFFQEQGNNQPLQQNVDGNKQHKPVISTSQETYKMT